MKANKNLIRGCFIPRAKTANKNDFGHILIAAGSRGMSGAAVLCANACVRSGAGLVTLAAGASIQPIVASKAQPEIMTLPLSETAEGVVRGDSAGKIFEYAGRRKIKTLAIGPGLGVTPETSGFVKKILAAFDGNIVLDADGINSIEEGDLRTSRAKLIITPHSGEFRRLLKKERRTLSTDEPAAFARKNRLICVLKGSGTIITDGTKTYKNSTGNPGMAVGGSGDVLTGMIAAFISQTKSPLMAALAAVYLHGLAGDISAEEKTMVSMLPSDVIENISVALKKTGIR